MNRLDYIIVGQGIAGSMLGWFLKKRGKQILVIDQPDPGSSSRVAAGIFNPITGRRFVKTWMADALFPFADETYREMEHLLGIRLFYPLRIIRQLSDQAERKIVDSKSSIKDYIPYLRWTAASTGSDEVEILRGGHLDTRAFVGAMQSYFRRANAFREDRIRYEDILPGDSFADWNGYRTTRLIFCEGYRSIYNPWFGDLPFTHAKGEILTIHAPDLKMDHILSRGIFVLPKGKDLYRVGATYDWDDLEESPTRKGREALTAKLDKLISCRYTVVEHMAGIRPTVRDRRPMIGLHREFPALGIFNGLGTKGVSLAPYFANHFICHLEDGMPLMREVDIRRFTTTA